MNKQFIYPAKTRIDKDGRIVITFPDLPFGATDGADREEALHEAADCLEEVIASLINHGEDIPQPSRPKRNQMLVLLSAQMSAKAALYLALREAGIGKSELARRIGCNVREVRRMLDPRHPTKLPRIEAALEALGKRLVVGMEEAAA